MLSVDPDVTTGVSYEETWADPGFFHKKSGGRGVGGRRGVLSENSRPHVL